MEKHLKQKKHTLLWVTLAFILAIVFNILLNSWLLMEEGKTGSGTFNPKKMSNASDKLIQLNRLTQNNNNSVPILVLGSSHVHWGLNPEKINTSLPIYNLSMEGTFFKSQLFLLKLLEKENKKPPLIILEISPLLTNIHLREYFIRRPVLPYILANHPNYLINELKQDPKSWVMFFQMIQKFHPVRSLLGEKKKKVYYTALGFEPRRELSGQERDDKNRFNNLSWNYVYDYQFDIKEAEKLIIYLKEKNIPAVFVAYPLSPLMQDVLKEKKVLQDFKHALNTLKENHLVTIADATDWYTDNTYFYDGNHLTGNGANQFSSDLSKELQPIFKELHLNNKISREEN